MNRAIVTVERDEFSKDFYIVLPERLLDKMGWKVGDNLKMDIIKMGIDRSLLIKKSVSDT